MTKYLSFASIINNEAHWITIVAVIIKIVIRIIVIIASTDKIITITYNFATIIIIIYYHSLVIITTIIIIKLAN